MPLNKLEKSIRIVLDTNNFISAQISNVGPSYQIFRMFKNEKIQIVTSDFQIKELERVLGYKRIAKKFKISQKKSGRIILLVHRRAKVIKPKMIPNVVKNDPDDDNILAIAKAGKVSYIVSGDEHLLGLKKFEGIPVVAAKEFVEKIGY